MNPTIILPFPDGNLSGHAFGNWRSKAKPTQQARALAYGTTMEHATKFKLPPKPDDILVEFHFYPPDLRGDRVNYPNRLKAYIDGIADALGFNDKRILPSYHFHPVDRENGRVEVVIREWQPLVDWYIHWGEEFTLPVRLQDEIDTEFGPLDD